MGILHGIFFFVEREIISLKEVEFTIEKERIVKRAFRVFFFLFFLLVS
jgi:hypothetical protein